MKKIPIGFTTIKKGKMQFLACGAINKLPGFFQAFSLRSGGHSKKPYDSMNVGMRTGDKTGNVIKNIRAIERAFDTKYISTVRQVHGDRVVLIQNPKFKIQNTKADAIATNVPGLAVGVRVADCAGTVIIDPEHRVIAAIHSGWRGVANKIPAKAVRVMRKKFKSDPAKLIAAVSPAIGPCCYEVGKEVYKLQKQAVFSNIFTESKGRVYMNLWKGVKNLLKSAGMTTRNIHVCGMCTACNPELFFSHRRDKGKTGRMLSFVVLK